MRNSKCVSYISCAVKLSNFIHTFVTTTNTDAIQTLMALRIPAIQSISQSQKWNLGLCHSLRLHHSTDTVYKGSSVRILLDRLFLDKFICKFNVFHYPFDKQECSVSFAITSVHRNFVTFKKENVKFIGEAALNNYIVSDFRIKRQDDPPKPFGILKVIFSLYTFIFCKPLTFYTILL